VPGLVVRKKAGFPSDFYAVEVRKEGRLDEIVETLDQKVGLNCVNGVFGTD
jgi:hypothetical protein